ncbi:MAG: hypothetical protein NTX61_12695 [Bacteroidetes bacterium]|nr:hypothetical protein [Bacteroidota bacterium]
MKKIPYFIIVFFICMIAVSSCYNDKEAYLYPFASICDSSNATYSQTIAPIMTANCNICHSTVLASGSVITDTWAGLNVVALNGKLWAGVDWSAGFSPMPKGSSKLSACDLAKIKKWINNGATNN